MAEERTEAPKYYASLTAIMDLLPPELRMSVFAAAAYQSMLVSNVAAESARFDIVADVVRKMTVEIARKAEEIARTKVDTHEVFGTRTDKFDVRQFEGGILVFSLNDFRDLLVKLRGAWQA